MESFSLMNSLDEQFDILVEKIPAIIKSIILKPNPEMKEAYFQLGHFLCSMLFNFSFILETDLTGYKLNSNLYDKNELNRNSLFFLKDETLMTQKSLYKFDFLNNIKYELTNQKELLVKCESIVKVCLQVIRTLCVYEKIFDLQYVCFVLLKRLYFTFPKYRNLIEDDLTLVLVNICLFTSQREVDNSQECRVFIYYLLNNKENYISNDSVSNSEKLSNDSIKAKLEKRIESKSAVVEPLESRNKEECKAIVYI